MCTGLEIAMVAGSVLSGAAAVSQMTKKSTPSVIRESPLADQAKIEGEAASRASARRRRIRASSLLATGGQGDTSSAATALPAAKQTLGG